MDPLLLLNFLPKTKPPNQFFFFFFFVRIRPDIFCVNLDDRTTQQESGRGGGGWGGSGWEEAGAGAVAGISKLHTQA